MIHFETVNAASGMKALTTRSDSPAAATPGAAFQTRRKTGGTLRSAAKRSRQTLLSDNSEVNILTAFDYFGDWAATDGP